MAGTTERGTIQEGKCARSKVRADSLADDETYTICKHEQYEDDQAISFFMFRDALATILLRARPFVSCNKLLDILKYRHRTSVYQRTIACAMVSRIQHQLGPRLTSGLWKRARLIDLRK